MVEPSATLTPVERIAIYGGMYYARLRDCLQENFPRLAQPKSPPALLPCSYRETIIRDVTIFCDSRKVFASPGC